MDMVLFDRNDLPVLIPNLILESQRILAKKAAAPTKKKMSQAAQAENGTT